MNDELFDWLVPVSYSPGHMGTFLQCFLTPKVDNLFYVENKKYDNHEWIFADIVDGFYGINPKTYNDLISVLYDFYPTHEVFEIAAIVILNTKLYLKYFIKADDLCTNNHMPLLLDFAKDKKYHQLHYPINLIKSRTSRYIKEHRVPLQFDKLKLVRYELPWTSKRIACDFLNEKSWIPYYLLKYKSHTSKYLIDNIILFDYDTDESFFKRSIIHEKMDFKQPTIQIDMYDLIFNKNIEQVYKADPNFEFTKEKEEMLNLANTSSIEILEYYGIDHTSCIDDNTTIQEVLAMQTKHQTLM